MFHRIYLLLCKWIDQIYRI